MCVTPNSLPDGTPIACRRCWACLQSRTTDLVGRAIAESRSADKTFSVTLTYAGDSLKNVVHCLEDVQKMVRAQRDAGFNVRYMCAGEFGEKFGRVHWHFVGFWRGPEPEVPTGRRIDWKFWPHGFSYFQEPDYHGLAYALKYAVKDATPGSVRPFTLSKKPPIGNDYFIALALDMARKGLPLHAPSYQFKNVRDRKGQIRTFCLQGKMRELFVQAYLNEWAFLRFLGEHRDGPSRTEWLYGTEQQDGFYYKLYPTETVRHQAETRYLEKREALRQAELKAAATPLFSNVDMINRANEGRL